MRRPGPDSGPDRGVFVTGTDTGVGKTVVAAAILSTWRGLGVDAVPMKPVQTGCTGRGKRLLAPDLDYCLSVAGLRADPCEYSLMAPYRYRPACSPHLAARLAGQSISFGRILASAKALLGTHEKLVVEGAGGLLVPVNGRRTMLDLIESFGFPVIVVARPGLGTLNHTLMTVELLRNCGLRIAGVVVNQSQPGRIGRIERDNLRTLERLGRVPILAFLRHGECDPSSRRMDFLARGGRMRRRP